jgi:cytochrome c553
MLLRSTILVAAVVVVSFDAAAAGDPVTGKALASRCSPCHGIDGVAKQPHVPNIAGESTMYLSKQLKAFRAGERQDPQMSLMAKPLSDEEIDDLVAWYSSIRFTVELSE